MSVTPLGALLFACLLQSTGRLCTVDRIPLVPPGPSPSTTYGFSVAVGSHFAFVGTFEEVVEVFVKEDRRWRHHTSLRSPTPRPGESFGYQLALDGNRLVVCAAGDTSPTVIPPALYVFELGDREWRFRERIDVSGSSASESFGTALDLDGETILAGAPYADDLGYLAGAAYVFRRIAGSWQQEARLLPDPAAPPFGATYGEFGRAVAVHEDRALVGAPGADSFYEFERRGAGWEQVEIVVGTSIDQTRFGGSIALRGSEALIGEPFWPSSIFPLGAAYEYERTATGWEERQRLVAPEISIGFAGTLAWDGDVAAFGTLGTVFLFPSRGVWVSRRGENAWSVPQRVSGSRPALAGRTLLVGDPGLTGPPGSASILTVGLAQAGGLETRIGPGNLEGLRAEPAAVGRTVEFQLAGGTTSDRIFAFGGPASQPTGFGTLLCWDPSGAPLFEGRFQASGSYFLYVPPARDLAGSRFCVQALKRLSTGYVLSNALDMTIGACSCGG